MHIVAVAHRDHEEGLVAPRSGAGAGGCSSSALGAAGEALGNLTEW